MIAAGLLPDAPGLRAAEGAEPGQFRTPDNRRKISDQTLETHGLNRLSSRRLILVTDLPIEVVRELPPLTDALFDTLEQQLGRLRPAQDGADFQVTGFLISVRERFENAGLLPTDGVDFRHGRNLGYEFWLNDQTSDYYRRHLLLHEFVHCFTMCEFGMRDLPPLWYVEGIAEYFATHELRDPVEKSAFGVLPNSSAGFEGWGRIATLRKSLASNPNGQLLVNSVTPLDRVRHPPDNNFVDDLRYAEAWALVWLIRHHPRWKQEFAGFAEVRSSDDFRTAEAAVPKSIWTEMSVVWPMYVDSLTEGFDPADLFPEKVSNRTAGLPCTENFAANREWQPSGLVLKSGQSVSVTCSGRYSVHDTPRPWFSEPQGITIDYYRGRPLGEVTAMLVSSDGSQSTQRIPIGIQRALVMPFEGSLWFQINDSAASRSGNNGFVRIHVE